MVVKRERIMKKKSKIKILIIDDDPEDVEITEARLKAHGYNVISTLDGLEGISIVRKQRPDLVLLDIVMPKVDGYAICKILKEDENIKKIPVILFTAKEMISDVEKGFAVGADDYIIKPVDWDRLMGKIEKLLSNKDIEKK